MKQILRRICAAALTALMLAGGSPAARAAGNNRIVGEDASDEEKILRLAVYTAYAGNMESPAFLRNYQCLYILRTMLVHTDTVMDERILYTESAVGIPYEVANEYIEALFGKPFPGLGLVFGAEDVYEERIDCPYDRGDGAYWFGRYGWNAPEGLDGGNCELVMRTENADGSITVQVEYDGWHFTGETMMTLLSADTAFGYRILSYASDVQ